MSLGNKVKSIIDSRPWIVALGLPALLIASAVSAEFLVGRSQAEYESNHLIKLRSEHNSKIMNYLNDAITAGSEVQETVSADSSELERTVYFLDLPPVDGIADIKLAQDNKGFYRAIELYSGDNVEDFSISNLIYRD